MKIATIKINSIHLEQIHQQRLHTLFSTSTALSKQYNCNVKLEEKK
jgi:hypothetical protein